MWPTFVMQTPQRLLLALALAVTFSLGVVGCGATTVQTQPSVNPPNPSTKPVVKWANPAGTNPAGVVILIHGGGWKANHDAYEAEMPLAAALQQQGYATVVVGYNAGADGFQEIEQVYSQAKKRYPGLPICADGISAGGHLALMLAAREPDLTCVVGLVTPTDLTTLPEQGGTEAYGLAVAAFGGDQLAKWSPVRYADKIKAKVLLMLAQTDPVVPLEQGREFVKADPRAQLYVIPAGPTPVEWLHGATTTAAAAQEAIDRGFAFIGQATSGG
jgi:acetyl esterase/lipase